MDSNMKWVMGELVSNSTIIKVGVDLRKDGGTLIIDKFPDIPFKYEWIDDDK